MPKLPTKTRPTGPGSPVGRAVKPRNASGEGTDEFTPEGQSNAEAAEPQTRAAARKAAGGGSTPPRKAAPRKAGPAAQLRAVKDDDAQGEGAPEQRTLGSADEFGFLPLDDTEDFINALYYGRESAGKTTNALMMANLPGAKRVLQLNAEGGAKKVALQRRGIDTSKVVTWPNDGQPITFARLEQLHAKLLSDLTDDPTSWTGVSFDSITEVHQALRENATDKRIGKLVAKEVDDIDEDFVDRDDYGVMTNQLRKLVRRFRDLPCHVVFTALERVDDKTGMVGPAITPALATDVMGYVDYVLYCKATVHIAGEDTDDAPAEFRALARPGKGARAKDRFGVLPPALADPDFIRVHSYTTGVLTEDKDPVQAAYLERRAAEQAARAEAEAAKAARKEAAKTKRSTGRARAAKATTDDKPATDAGEE